MLFDSLEPASCVDDVINKGGIFGESMKYLASQHLFGVFISKERTSMVAPPGSSHEAQIVIHLYKYEYNSQVELADSK